MHTHIHTHTHTYIYIYIYKLEKYIVHQYKSSMYGCVECIHARMNMSTRMYVRMRLYLYMRSCV